MFIDAHVHFWNKESCVENTWFFMEVKPEYYGWWAKNFRNVDVSEEKSTVADYDPRRIEKALRSYGVEKAVAFAMNIPGVQYVTNDYIANGVKESKGFFVGIASVDPKKPKAEEELIYALSSLGLKGLKIFPIIQHFRPDDFVLTDRLYKICIDYDVPVVIHLAAEPAEEGGILFTKTHSGARSRLIYNQAIYIDEVSYRYPELKIVVAHADYGLNISAAAMLCARRPNVYVDLARFGDRLQYAEEIEQIPPEKRDESLYLAYRAVGKEWVKRKFYDDLKHLLLYARPNRIIFGSDFPAINPRWYKETISEVVEDKSVLKMIFEDNAKRIYKL